MTKVIFVTGATSGFGLEIARRFANEGWKVAATYRSEEKREALDAIGGVAVYKLDVTEDDQVERVARQVTDEVGVPDVLVNNAGYCLMGSLEASSMEQIRQQFDVNTFGLIAVTKAFLPDLRKRGGGMIVNISSSSAIANYPFVSAYGASKWAVRGLSESLFLELAPFSIKVKAIFPGLHSTKIFTKLESALGPGHEAYANEFRNFVEMQSETGGAGDPRQVADTIWEIVEKDEDKRDYIVNRDAKMLAVMKRFMSDASWKKMNVKMIAGKPSKAIKRMMKWQINGTKPLQFEPDARLSGREKQP